VTAKAFQFVERHIPDSHVPFGEKHAWYVLMEVSGAGAEERLEHALSASMENGDLLDAVIAKSGDEAARLWRLRHSISEAQKLERTSVKHDVSVPIASIEPFLERCESKLSASMSSAEPVIFGHVGDGNLHYNVMFPRDTSPDEMSANSERVTGLIYDLVDEMNGSFSAEHGVGQLKRKHLLQYTDALDIELMRTLKKALDPANILNPGKVI
jgi:FAD/FMN-containing dehydrogenase